MRILHTGDWHVGRTLRGVSRAVEHEVVLSEIAEIVRREKVDLVLIAGDVFDSAVPSPDAEELVYRILLRFADAGAEVVLVAGNHDNPRRLRAIKPLLSRAARVHVAERPLPAGEGGIIDLETGRGERFQIALFPFLSQQAMVRAADLFSKESEQHVRTYAEKCSEVLESLTGALSAESVKIVLGHLTVRGARRGGGERDAHTTVEYTVPATAFNKHEIHYAALGHMHRSQVLPAACPLWYCGSPLQLDFGDCDEKKSVLLVEATAHAPARVERVFLQSGRPLRTIEGSLTDLEKYASNGRDEFLRVDLTEPPRPGLAREVRELLPNAVAVRILESAPGTPPLIPPFRGSPRELFGEFLRDRGKEDKRVLTLFDDLLEEVYAAETA